MNVSSSGPYYKANIFLGLIEYELNILLGTIYQFIFYSTLKDICQICKHLCNLRICPFCIKEADLQLVISC